MCIRDRCSPRPGTRFTWHRLVATDGANKVVALEAGGTAIEFSGQCPYSGGHRTDTQGFSDGFVRCQIVSFARPAQSSVQILRLCYILVHSFLPP